MALSIITPVYSSRPYLVEMVENLYLDSVLKNVPSDAELILVDDCSPLQRENEAVARRFEKKFKNTVYVKTSKNQGFASACNLGIKLAKYDPVMITNSDIRFTKGSVDSLLDAICSTKQVGIVGPMSNNTGNYLPQKASGFESLHAFTKEEFARLERFAEQVRSSGKGTIDVTLIVGLCMAIKKSVFNDIGYFDERFKRGYAEEIDFCFRAKNAGYKILVDQGTFIYHGGKKERLYNQLINFSSQSFRTRPMDAVLAFISNNARFIGKHGLRNYLSILMPFWYSKRELE